MANARALTSLVSALGLLAAPAAAQTAVAPAAASSPPAPSRRTDERLSTPLMVTGIVLIPLGVTSAIAGAVVSAGSCGDPNNRLFFNCSLGHPEIGGPLSTIGLVAIPTGIVLTIVGAYRPGVARAVTPELGPHFAGLSLRARF